MLNLSRCPRGTNIHSKKGRSIPNKSTLQSSSTTAKNQNTSKLERPRKRQRHDTKGLTLPIPSFQSHSQELERLEREFLGEDEENDGTAVNANLGITTTTTTTKVPIPKFTWQNGEETESESGDDIMQASSFDNNVRTATTHKVESKMHNITKKNQDAPFDEGKRSQHHDPSSSCQERRSSQYLNERIAKEFEEEKNGQVVKTIYYGTIDKVEENSENKLWHVKYDDNDEEEFDEQEMKTFRKFYDLHRDNDPLLQTLPKPSTRARNLVHSAPLVDKPNGDDRNSLHESEKMESHLGHKKMVSVDENTQEVESSIRRKPTDQKTKTQAKAKKRTGVTVPQKDSRGVATGKRKKNEDQPSKQAGQRKRARKGKCALCTTCSCQKPRDDEMDIAFDMKTFSRSDGAIEKALIRRLKKIEKSTEHLEEQTEIVRRKLRKHQREIQKKEKRHKRKAETGTRRPYFLPDVEEVENQKHQSKALSRGIATKAVDCVFPNVPQFQQTLTQLGFPSKERRNSKEAVQGTIQDLQDTVSKEAGIELINLLEVDDPGKEIVPLPVEDCDPEPDDPDIVDDIERVIWNGGVKSAEEEGKTAYSQSLWGALERDCRSQSQSPGQSSWDKLFSNNFNATDLEHNGLEELFNLFMNECPRSTQDESVERDKEVVEKTASLSMLSQGCQEAVKRIYSKVDGNSKKVSAMSRVCPNWRENVVFAFLQNDEDTILQAMENLRKSRSKMLETKQRILESWESHQTALELLEISMNESLARLKSDLPSEAVGGFMTQCAQNEE